MQLDIDVERVGARQTLKGNSMNNQTSNSYALRRETGATLFTYGLWIRLGFVGAAGVLAGLLLLFDAGSTAGLALLVLAGGAGLAATSWRKLRVVLALGDEADPGAPDTTPTVGVPRAPSALRSPTMQATAR
jgi:hypothetical protein